MSLVTQYAYSAIYLVIFIVGGKLTDTNEDILRPWVLKVRNSRWKYVLVGGAASFCGWWTDTVVIPTIQGYLNAGPLMTAAIIIQVIIGIGLGLSIAKWATERAYRFWSNPHKHN